MKYIFLLYITFSALVSCNNNKKGKETPDIKTDTATSTTPPAGKIDIETFGPIKIGQSYNETFRVLGSPDKRTVPVEWGADGLMHEEWGYSTKGIKINMVAEKGKPNTKTIFSITATPPCNFLTAAEVGIGSSYATVEKFYERDIDKETKSKEQIVVGSVYGGIIFSFDAPGGKVNKIFLGAAAE